MVSDLYEVWRNLCEARDAADRDRAQNPEAAADPRPSNLQEAYHDTLQLRDEANTLFSLGYLSLSDRARAERLVLCC